MPFLRKTSSPSPVIGDEAQRSGSGKIVVAFAMLLFSLLSVFIFVSLLVGRGFRWILIPVLSSFLLGFLDPANPAGRDIFLNISLLQLSDLHMGDHNLITVWLNFHGIAGFPT
jgi:hypothetical protein